MRALVIVKVIHTLAWAFFAGCIVGLPTLVEVVILAVNGWRCPLTDIAARFTDDRRENFDINLPRWLAKHNKAIFGTVFIGGGLMPPFAAALRWR